MDNRNLKVFWSAEDGCYIAVCNERPGCSAAAITVGKAVRELAHAREAWDEARKDAAGQQAPKEE